MLEGDVSGISSQTIRSLREFVEQELKAKNYRIIVSLASKAGANNFTGTIYRASFWKQQHDEVGNESNREQKMIIKVAPQQPEWRDQLSIRPTFLQEKYIYDTVSKCGNPKQIIFNFYSNCPF